MSIKKGFIVGLSALLLSVAVSRPAMADYLYGLDAWEEFLLWIIDPADGSRIGAHSVNLASGDIRSQTGMAVDPTSGTMYVVIAVNSGTNRSLFTLDPETGDTTLIGNLTYPFASIVFDDSGTLYGVTGSNSQIEADNRNALFTIDPTDASLTRLCKFGSGNQGHALAYGDAVLYHAQQAGTQYSGDTILESVDTSSFPATNTDPCPTTSIPLTYGDGGLPVHPMSILVTATGTGTATLLLSGWNAVACCDQELFSVAIDSGSAVATKIGTPDTFFKGMAFHAFEPPTFASTQGLSVTKVSAKFRAGKERRVVYTIEVSNSSNDPVPGVTLTDNLDFSKTVYLSDDAGCDLVGGSLVTCDLGTIAAQSSETITIDTSVVCKGKNCSSVFNQANVEVSLDQWVDNPFNTSTSASINTPLKGKY